MTNNTVIIDVKTNIAPIWAQMKEITARKKAQIAKLPQELSKIERAIRAESIRTEPVTLTEPYALPKHRALEASTVVSSKEQLKQMALIKTVMTGQKHEPQAPITLGEYLDALYLSTSGYRDGGISLMYRRNQKVINDFKHPKEPSKYETVNATITSTRMVWDTKSLLRHTHTRRTLYHSLNTFNGVRRVKEEVRQIHACYMDVDCYKTGYSQSRVVEEIYEMVTDGKIPEPSFIIFSGRGVYAIWLLHDVPGTSKTKKYYDVVQTKLVSYFEHLGADHQAKGVNGYLRLPGSYHPVAKKKVEIVHHNTSNRYTLTDFGVAIGAGAPTKVVPMVKPSTRPVPQRTDLIKKSKKVNFGHSSYQYLFQQELKQLLMLRGYHMYKCRDTWLYMMHHSMLRSGYEPELVMDKLLAYNDRFTEPLPVSEVYALVEPSYERYLEWVDQRERIANGTWEDCPEGKYKGYNWFPRTVIEALSITESEMQHLKLFVHKDIKQARKTAYEAGRKEEHNRKRREKRRNEKNLTKREAIKEKNICDVKALLAQGVKQKDIAITLGLTKGRVSQIVKQIKAESK